MKVIIAGSRGIKRYSTVKNAIESALLTYPALKRATQIVSGGARGVDRLGERWGREKGIPRKRFLPDWDLHDMSAGHMRNREMAEYADALIAIWDGKSTGTKSMIGYARKNKLLVYIYKVK